MTSIIDEGDFDAERCLKALRFLASVGEPLNPEAVMWGADAFGLPFHDNWWQTETGGIMIANYAAMEVRPGSMGRPLNGVEAAIVHRTGESDVRWWPNTTFKVSSRSVRAGRRCFAGTSATMRNIESVSWEGIT